MPYGILKADTLTYYTATGDVSVAISGIAISGSPLISGVSGVFTTSVSGATVTGNAGQFTTITGGTAQFTNITGVSGTFTSRISGATVTGTSGQFTTLTTATGVFTTSISGATISGDLGLFSTISGSQGFFSSSLSVPSGTASSPSISFNGDPNTGIYSPGADQLAISTGGAQRLVVNANGDIVATGGSLTLGATGGEGGQLSISNTTNTGSVYVLDASTDTNARLFTANNNCNLQIGQLVGTGGNVQLFAGGTERLRITSSGLVGVGTNNPAEILDVRRTGVNPVLALTRDDAAVAGALYIGAGSTLNYIQSQGAKDLNFQTNSIERLRITSAGLVGIGTSSPGEKLSVFGGNIEIDEQVAGRRIGFDLSSNFTPPGGNVTADYGLTFQPSAESFSVGLSGFTSLNFYTNRAERLRIDASGRVGIGTTSPGEALEVNGNIRLSSNSGSFRLFGAADSSNTTVVLQAGGASGTGGNIELDRNGDVVYDGTNHRFRNVTGGSEYARIDSNGRLLVGTSSARSNFFNTAQATALQLEGTGTAGASFSIVSNRADGTEAPFLILGRTNSGSVGGNALVSSGNEVGAVSFQAADGSELVSCASISAFVDGTPGANDMPGRLVFSTTADGASSPTERMRITNDGVQGYNQASPAAVNATATLTVANLKTGIVTSTSAAATDMTLPTGTDTEGGFSGLYTNFTFEWSVINTGPSLVRVLAATAHTIVGSGSVATGTSGRFASRRTAANTFVTYRLS
jgi:hypothetical protein